MTLNIILRSPVPERPYGAELCCIPPEGVPYCLGAMRLRFSEYWYTSPEDYVRGRSLLAELGGGLLMPCGQDIINAVDRVYILLAGVYNGTSRGAELAEGEDNVYVYDPPLSQAIDATDYSTPGLRTNADIARELLDNLVSGAVTANTPLVAVPNGHLQAIYDQLLAMAAEEQVSPEQIAQIITILGAV